MNCKTTVTVLFLFLIASTFMLFGSNSDAAFGEYDFKDEYGFGYDIIDGTNNVIFYFNNAEIESAVLDESQGFRSEVAHGGKTYTVTELGVSAFINAEFTKIVIPETVEVIHMDCFVSSDVDSIDFSNVTTIGIGAFSNSTVFEDKIVYINEKITHIYPGAFVSCGCKGFNVSNDNPEYKVINESLCTRDNQQLVAFPEKLMKTDYKLPSVEIIDEYAFYNAELYEELCIPESVKRIGFGAFNGTKINKLDFKGNNLEMIETNAFSGIGIEGTLEFPKSLKIICSTAFNENNITEVKFNEGLEYIGSMAFGNCRNLSKITFSDSIKFIGLAAFTNTLLNVTGVQITMPKSLEALGEQAFFGCSGLDGGEVIFPGGKPVIGWGAFCLGEGTSLTITGFDPDSNLIYNTLSDGGNYRTDLENFEENEEAVHDSDNLFTGVSFDGNTAIITGATISNLNNVVLPEKMFNEEGDEYKVIGVCEFDLTANKITFPSSIESITAYMGICFSVSEVEFSTENSNLKYVSVNSFYSQELKDNFVFPDSMVYAGSDVFSMDSAIKSIDTGGIRYIEGNMISNYALENLKLGENLEYIGAGAFACNKLTNLTIPKNVRFIGNGAFNYNETMNGGKLIFEGDEPLMEQSALAFGLTKNTNIEIITNGWEPSNFDYYLFDFTHISKWTDLSIYDFDYWWISLLAILIVSAIIFYLGKNKQ